MIDSCSDVVRRFLVAAVVVGASSPVNAQVDPAIHELCSNVKDYLGCVKAQNPSNSATDNAEECWKTNGYKWCVANDGLDRFGLPKLAGYIYTIVSEGEIYYYAWDGVKRRDGIPAVLVYQIPHKNQSRYIGTKFTWRYFQPGSAGTAPISTTVGAAQTSCTSIGGFVNCSTTPAPTINIPGTPARAGGVRTQSYIDVFDCKDMTNVNYANRKPIGRW